jgi:hypothetical protein
MTSSVLLTWLGWPLFVLVSWVIFYFVFIRPMLAKIHTTMGVPTTATTKAAIIDALVSGAPVPPVEPWWQRALQKVEGAKTVIVAFLTSLLGVLSSDTSILNTLQTEIPWASLLTPTIAIRITSGLMFLVAFLHLYGKLKAAQTSPQGS